MATNYRVIVTPEAEDDLRIAYRYIRRHAPQAAREWMRRVRQSIGTLRNYPERCSVAPESDSFDQTVRQLLFGKGNRGTYRILFVIIDRTVFILHMRHGSMLPLEPEE